MALSSVCHAKHPHGLSSLQSAAVCQETKRQWAARVRESEEHQDADKERVTERFKNRNKKQKLWDFSPAGKEWTINYKTELCKETIIREQKIK